MCSNHTNTPAIRGKFCQKCLDYHGLNGRYINNKEGWKSVDWTMPKKELAKKMGVTVVAVRYQAKKRGVLTSERKGVIPYDYSSINWQQGNRAIASQTGLHQVTVAEARQKYAPETRYKRFKA